MPADTLRVERGDWQTPPVLAKRVLALLRRRGITAASVVEPTCGHGTFVHAAVDAFRDARIYGFELSEAHLAVARASLHQTRVTLRQANFFSVDWEAVLAPLAEPLLVLGNPPWVTSATLGALASSNLPAKSNLKGLRGLDAKTGKGNFDLAEWMILRLLEALREREFTLAMLCKSSVARRVIEVLHAWSWRLCGAIYVIDAHTHFDAAVDAVLLTVTRDRNDTPTARWSVYKDLEAREASHAIGVVGGVLCSDIDAYERHQTFAGHAEMAWRSGIKHDCAAVMELRREGTTLRNGLGETVDIEAECLYPLLKGSDVANGRAAGRRYVVVTQRTLGEDTEVLRTRAPRTWQYLMKHRVRFEARKSSIYRKQPLFAMFGVGPYTFAPFKVAICGLYKRMTFRVVGPYEGRPVVLDDTNYFLACTEGDATRIAHALNSEAAQAFFAARVFWDAKRPIHKGLLQGLSLDTLLRATERA